MNKAARVRYLQYGADLGRNLYRFACLQLATLPDELLQRGTMYILHQKELLAYLFDNIIDGDGVRVSECGCGAGFSTEALDGS